MQSMHCGFEINKEQVEKFTIDNYKGTFYIISLNCVCAYLLADWGTYEENKKK